jgi:endonuclease YncB( thermonuclease family)
MPQESSRRTNALLAHLVCLVLFCVSATTVEAASLYGKVIEVNSGDVFTIVNLNRPVRVKLLGVDAPALNQAFGDVARKHLSDLVFDKPVLVNYSGISADSTITGRVLLNDADVGAQMIRDGAAWFNPNTSDRLTTMERDVYQQSEQAARSERRGLWQEANPTAPWEFVKAENLRLHPVAPVKTNEPAAPTSVKRSNPGSGLTNISLMNVKAASSPASGPALPNDFEVVEADELPAGLPFVASPPRKGSLITKTTLFGGQMVKANAYVAVEEQNAYSITWFTAPTLGEDDKTAMDQLVFNELIAATAGAYTGGDAQARCNPQSEKDISSNGYWGREVDMSQCQIPTRLRVFTKVTGDRREVYLAMVGVNNDNPNVTRFLKTFTIRAKKN